MPAGARWPQDSRSRGPSTLWDAAASWEMLLSELWLHLQLSLLLPVINQSQTNPETKATVTTALTRNQSSQ